MGNKESTSTSTPIYDEDKGASKQAITKQAIKGHNIYEFTTSLPPAAKMHQHIAEENRELSTEMSNFMISTEEYGKHPLYLTL